ncbi:MAG: HNH endonuclease [Mesorhizobium sp.]|nr:MAG: HNH endonuclease [Mesorhizobium sp.]
MARTQGHGNPAWSRDETILALDLYFDHDGNVPSPRQSPVVELSTLLRSLPYHAEAARQPTFRNPDGVGFKLMNLRQVATGRGLGNVSRIDREIWAEYGNSPSEVKRLSNAIRRGIKDAEWASPDIVEDVEEFKEGGLLTRLHYRRERNPKVRARLMLARETAGLRCEICDLHRPDLPAPLQQSVFEAHHLVPIAEAVQRATRLSDMALRCACCHRLLHKMIATDGKWITPAEARGRISK